MIFLTMLGLIVGWSLRHFGPDCNIETFEWITTDIQGSQKMNPTKFS